MSGYQYENNDRQQNPLPLSEHFLRYSLRIYFVRLVNVQASVQQYDFFSQMFTKNTPNGFP